MFWNGRVDSAISLMKSKLTSPAWIRCINRPCSHEHSSRCLEYREIARVPGGADERFVNDGHGGQPSSQAS